MSEKEAKLAAARKRAEALKAKRAQQVEADTNDDNTPTPAGNPVEDSPITVTETTSEEAARITELREEVERLQDLLQQSTSQQEALRKEVEDGRTSSQLTISGLKSRIAELENAESRRDDQVQRLELELSKVRQEKDSSDHSATEMQTTIQSLQSDLAAANENSEDHDKTKALQEEVDALTQARAQTNERLENLQKELGVAQTTMASMQSALDESRSKVADSAKVSEAGQEELHVKAKALQAENQNLIAQLSELRSRLISVQDEKFALGEAIERLQKELKDAKSVKANQILSGEVPRARLSKDFDRSVSLQNVSLSENPTSQQRDPRSPPADLQSNIQIDLTSWYDKHAGEVIEV